jgi:hypothetical protein
MGFTHFKNEVYIHRKLEIQGLPIENTADSLFVYAQQPEAKIATAYSNAVGAQHWHTFISDGQGGPKTFTWLDQSLTLTPPTGNHWKWKQERIDSALHNYYSLPEEARESPAALQAHLQQYQSLPKPRRPKYLKMSAKHKPLYLTWSDPTVLNTVWDDIPGSVEVDGYHLWSPAVVKRIHEVFGAGNGLALHLFAHGARHHKIRKN